MFGVGAGVQDGDLGALAVVAGRPGEVGVDLLGGPVEAGLDRSSQSFFIPAAERERLLVTSAQKPAAFSLSALSATPSMTGRASPRSAPGGVAGVDREVSLA